MRSLQKKYPKLVKLESIGYTIKGRDIYAVKLSQGPCPEKWMVLIDACIHAREWITVTSALCVIDHILATPMLLYMFDYYIIPCLNPDGYEFSHTKVSGYMPTLHSTFNPIKEKQVLLQIYLRRQANSVLYMPDR